MGQGGWDEAVMPRCISLNALIARINRRLRPRNRLLRKSRGAQARAALGDYHLIDFNVPVRPPVPVDIEALGRDLGVLTADEYVAHAVDAP
jgi:hypothetical protein